MTVIDCSCVALDHDLGGSEDESGGFRLHGLRSFHFSDLHVSNKEKNAKKEND